MAVEVLDYQGFSKLHRDDNADDAMVTHLRSMQSFVSLLAKQQQQQAKQENCPLMNDTAMSEFKKLITLLGGSGHARFRRAPAQHVDRLRSSSPLHDAAPTKRFSNTDVQPLSSSSPSQTAEACVHNVSVHDASPIVHSSPVSQPFPSGCPSKNEVKVNGCVHSVSMQDASPMCVASMDTQNSLHVSGHARCRDSTTHKPGHQDCAVMHQNTRCELRHHVRPCGELDQAAPFMPSKTNSSFLSSLSMEVGGGTVSNGKPVISSGRPPLPPKKRKSLEKIEERSMKCHNSAQCHCAKRRKMETRRILRVSAIGLANTEIPEDGHSWCEYGQKFSRGSLQPRVYYKCSSVRGCPARKHVQRASDDSNILIVTYGREHLHPQIPKVVVASK